MATNKLYKYHDGSALLGVLFLLAAAIVGVTLVTNKNITLNPGKKAEVYGCYCPSSACSGGCWWGSGGPYKCSDSKCSTPAPAPTKTPTPKPRTPSPIPTSACNQKGLLHSCPFKSSSERECMAEAIHTFEVLGYNVVPNCCSLVDCGGANDNCYACYVTRIYPTPTPSIQVVKITSGTCSSKCVAIKGTCLNVGTNLDGNNGKVMSWGNWTSCVTRTGTCNSTVTQLSSGGTKCSGGLPEWTNCRCKRNPYVN